MTNPYGALTQGRVDQGVDYSGKGPIYALGSGKVLYTSQPGWPGLGNFLEYVVTKGQAAGRYVYVAEDFLLAPGLKPGSSVSAGQQVGTATGGSTGIETGWATASGSTLARAQGDVNPVTHHSTAGEDFAKFLESVGVASPPPIGGKGGAGAVGSGASPGGGLIPSASDINSAARHIPGVAQAEGVVGATESVGKFLGQLADPNLWIRVLEIVGGSVIALTGLYLLVKQVGLSPDTVSSLRSTPAETMAQEAERVSSEGFRKGFVQGQREAGRSAGRKAGRSVVV